MIREYAFKQAEEPNTFSNIYLDQGVEAVSALTEAIDKMIEDLNIEPKEYSPLLHCLQRRE